MVFYKIDLPKKMISGDDDEEHTIFINEVYKDRRIPIPDKIKITEE